jgi:ArsR family transcriptional regulator
MEIYDTEAKLFKVLMHPTRLAILDILRDGEQCVCHMEAHLGLRQAYISQQLMVLREAGLVEDRRDGWNIFYRVIKPEIYAVMDAALEVTGEERKPRVILRNMNACPCPKCSVMVEHSN